MLLIEQIEEMDLVRSSYVRCPACKLGRLCDRPAGEKAVGVVIHGSALKREGSRIILKCPKCSQKFIMSFTKE